MVSTRSNFISSLALFMFLCSSSDQAAINQVRSRLSPPAVINLGQQKHYMGDLVLSPKTRNAIYQTQRWQNGIVYYEIRSSYKRDEIEMILSAIRLIEQYTCVRFIPRTSETDYIYFVNTNDGCYSTGVGKAGGSQEISLQSSSSATCMSMPIILHEIMHAIGLWHEHVRFDRDTYVTIKWENIKPGLEPQFQTVTPIRSTVYDLPYDYYSVMHYDAFAFGAGDGVTMQPKDGRFLRIIGKVRGASTTDFEKIRRIYGCPRTSGQIGADSAGDSNCLDLSTNCLSYQHLCGRWALLNTYCRRTCQQCANVWNGGRWRAAGQTLRALNLSDALAAEHGRIEF